jgi:hypothetical protein
MGVMVFARSVLAPPVVFASPLNGWHGFPPSRLFDPVGYGGWPHDTVRGAVRTASCHPRSIRCSPHHAESLESVVRSFGPRAKRRATRGGLGSSHSVRACTTRAHRVAPFTGSFSACSNGTCAAWDDPANTICVRFCMGQPVTHLNRNVTTSGRVNPPMCTMRRLRRVWHPPARSGSEAV